MENVSGQQRGGLGAYRFAGCISKGIDSLGWRLCLAGIVGNGDAFAMRDPLGIRPGFYFEDDEVVAVASERAPLMTVFEKKMDEVSEIDPGSIIVIRANGEVVKERFAEDPARRTACSFERIYFSRGVIRHCRGTWCTSRSSGSRSCGKRFF